MINTPLIIAYISAIILFLGTPGPVTVMVANTSTKYGFKAGIKTVAGTNTASLLLIALSMAVIQGLFAISEQALLWLTLFGSLYVLYFAIGILKDRVEINLNKQTNSPSVDKKFFKDGFLVGISNPKDVLFFIAFFPMFFGVAEDKLLAMGILVSIWVVLDYGILSVYSLLFSKVTNNKIANVINKLSGAVLACVAVYATVMTAIKLQLGSKLLVK
ncbi:MULTISPECIES: LysE family translocator [unclassified Moraxella]|uniref:LysE family translocator n=1 Tax=unclassified Moraxella TaxID=2685852 RepID=UPI003AF42192